MLCRGHYFILCYGFVIFHCVSLCVCVHQVFIHSSVSGHLGYFHAPRSLLQSLLLNQTWVGSPCTVKQAYWHWVVLKEGIAFIARPSKDSGQLILKRPRLPYGLMTGWGRELCGTWSAHGSYSHWLAQRESGSGSNLRGASVLVVRVQQTSST